MGDASSRRWPPEPRRPALTLPSRGPLSHGAETRGPMGPAQITATASLSTAQRVPRSLSATLVTGPAAHVHVSVTEMQILPNDTQPSIQKIKLHYKKNLTRMNLFLPVILWSLGHRSFQEILKTRNAYLPSGQNWPFLPGTGSVLGVRSQTRAAVSVPQNEGPREQQRR